MDQPFDHDNRYVQLPVDPALSSSSVTTEPIKLTEQSTIPHYEGQPSWIRRAFPVYLQLLADNHSLNGSETPCSTSHLPPPVSPSLPPLLIQPDLAQCHTLRAAAMRGGRTRRMWGLLASLLKATLGSRR